MKQTHQVIVWSITSVVLLAWAQTALAGGLGIPLDGWLTTFVTFVQGLGVALGTVGLAGWIGSLFDNPFSTILAGSINYFTKAGLLGGGLIILPALGLVAGATL